MPAVRPPDPALVFDGLVVARLRRQQRLTQAALAIRTGCSEDMIRSMETGRAWPSIRMLPRLAGALNVGVDALFRQVDGAA
jgi:transcriptional regulator with XRE-family HTH domain